MCLCIDTLMLKPIQTAHHSSSLSTMSDTESARGAQRTQETQAKTISRLASEVVDTVHAVFSASPGGSDVPETMGQRVAMRLWKHDPTNTDTARFVQRGLAADGNWAIRSNIRSEFDLRSVGRFTSEMEKTLTAIDQSNVPML